MALHLNFYHEIQKDAQVRARDPIKLAGIGAALVALLLLGYYFYRSSEVSGIQSAHRAKEAEWKKLEPQLKSTTQRQKDLAAEQAKNARLVNRIKGRFYWAPLLQQIAGLTPPEVQLTSMDSRIDDQTVTLIIQGMSAGEQPRLVAEQFRAGLERELGEKYTAVNAGFDGNSLEDLSRNATLNGKALPMARFVLRISFKASAPPAEAEEEVKPEASKTEKPEKKAK